MQRLCLKLRDPWGARGRERLQYPLLCIFSKCQLSDHCVPDPVPGPEDRAVTRTHRSRHSRCHQTVPSQGPAPAWGIRREQREWGKTQAQMRGQHVQRLEGRNKW